MAEISYTPVDYDPFAAPASPPQTGGQSQPRLTPVDYDPFAAAPTESASPTGFATRAQREGTDAQIRDGAYLADAIRMRNDQDRSSPVGRVDAYVRGVSSWIPGMDKLAAAGDAVFGRGQGESFGERYADNLARERALDTADAAVNSGSRLAGQGAGLVSTAAVLPSITAVREGVRGATTANAALTGGAYGAVTGAIESDGGIAEKAQNAASLGALGAAGGAVAPHLVNGVAAAGRGIGAVANRAVAPVRTMLAPEAEAARRVNSALARDGVTEPAEALAEMQARGAPAVVGDVGGETTRALARSATNTSPEAREALVAATEDRFASQSDRVTDLIRGMGRSSAMRTQEELQSAARAQNGPAYRKAYFEGGRGIWTPELEMLAQAPAVQDAFRSVIKTGANKTVADGLPPIRNPFTTDAAGNLSLTRNADGTTATPNLQFWDYVQRELRGKAGEAARAGNKDLAGDFTNLRRHLLDQLDTAFPSFRQARTGAAEFFGAEDALEAGQKFVVSTMRNDQARSAVAKMKPAERELFAEGFRSDLLAKVRQIGDGRDVVKGIAGSPAAREKLEIALGKEAADDLMAALRTETAMNQLRGAVSGNSTTAQQIANLAMAGGFPAGGGLVGYWHSGSPGAFAGAVAAAGIRRGQLKIDQRLAKRVGEMLASGDAKELARVAGMARKSKVVSGFLDTLSDEAGKLVGLNSPGPLEIGLRSRGAPVNLPAAADQEQR